MSARASGETVTESQNKKVSVADNHSVTMKCTATFVTRYNASKKRRFITQIKSAKVTVSVVMDFHGRSHLQLQNV